MSEFINPKSDQRHALLPETLGVFRVADMSLDDVRFARPYAMHVDTSRRAWLDSTHPTSPDETSSMCLMISLTLEGYCVTVQDDPEAGWDTEDPDALLTQYGDDVRWLPVARIFDPRTNRL